MFTAKKAVIAQRCVHLDLKGTPPTPSRLLQLLKVFAAARYNSVLVEWEDSFPWTVDERFRSATAYSPATVRKFVETAGNLGVELIPLVQCLGHMETPLRLRKYAHLRELPNDESDLNPLAPGARELVCRMMDDVLALMPGVKHFHLGGDEARTFGANPQTKKYVARYGKGMLYLYHVEPLLDKLIKREIRPMLWHDMMRDWDSSALRMLGRKSDLVAWGYRGHPYSIGKHCNKAMIERFKKHDIILWGGAAYKGADGSDADLPKIDVREKNALGWVEAALRYKFNGVIATAWSRYRTGGLQNEPIDGALDSAFNLGVILHDGKPPRGGIEACRRELRRIGEGRASDNARKSLSELSEIRNNAWAIIKILRQLLVSMAHDPRRGSCCSLLVKNLRNLQDQLAAAEKTANELKKALKGLMETVWIECYLAERIEPLREEFAMLEARVRRRSPRAYADLLHCLN